MEQKLRQVLRNFILEHNFNWNHEDWLLLVKACRGYELSDEELGKLLELERQKLLEEIKLFYSQNSEGFDELQNKIKEIVEKEEFLKKKEAELISLAKQIEEDKKLNDFIFETKNIEMTEREIRKGEKEILNGLKQRYDKLKKKEKELERREYYIQKKELELTKREESILRKEFDMILK